MSAINSTSRLAAAAYPALWTAMWLVMMTVAIIFRPFLPVDETRYLAVAWDMWRDGNFLVPHLNGETYSHKPPLLFWLINAGWAVFGLNDWWPRLVAPLFGLASLFMTAALGRRLWPGRPAVAVAAPLILLSFLFWTLFTTLTMFDMLLVFCALLAMLGIVRAWQDDNAGGFVWLALAIGIGILAKGPAILLSTLPAALLAPLWVAGDRTWSRGWKRWYAGVGLALLGGLAIGLAWAVPAAIVGGEEYGKAIFWGQSAGRMVDSFAHGRPWWWFMAVLPVLLLPLTLWPAFWRSMAGLGHIRRDNGLRFCLAWFLPALIVFSTISGKQLHYLLPVFPALALVAGRLLADHHDADIDHAPWRRSGLHVPGALFMVFGLALGAAPFAAALFDLPPVVGGIDFIWGPLLALLAMAAIYAGGYGPGLAARLGILGFLSTASIVALHLSLAPVLAERFDLKPISQKLGQWQRSGVALAFVGKYHGQFNFMGRLQTPIAVIGLKGDDLKDWLAENPEGRIVRVIGRLPEASATLYSQPYRGRFLIVFDSARALADPAIYKKY